MFFLQIGSYKCTYHVDAEFFSTKQGRRDLLPSVWGYPGKSAEMWENPLPSATNFPPWRSDLWLPQTLEVTFPTFPKGHFIIPKKVTKNCQAQIFCWVKLLMFHQQLPKKKGLSRPPSTFFEPKFLSCVKPRRTTVPSSWCWCPNRPLGRRQATSRKAQGPQTSRFWANMVCLTTSTRY